MWLSLLPPYFEELLVVVPSLTAITSTAAALAAQMEEAFDQARQFATSIMLDMEKIPDSNGMQVMRDIFDLETGSKMNIVIRPLTESFWNECLRVFDEPDMRYRLCAVGTPGIGKTTSIPFLIRMLFQRECTVVYRVATQDLSGYFWEFKWENKRYVAKVYPEKDGLDNVPSLNEKSTFYIVDPGITKTSCLPECIFRPRTIIVASPDECHWGRGELFKRRGDVIGRVLYFPLWDLKELLSARQYFRFGEQLSEEDVRARFRLFGGIPRHVFLPEKYFHSVLQTQDDAIGVLTKEQVIRIALQRMDAVGSFAPGQPKSAIIGYARGEGGTPFSIENVVTISPLVDEKVYSKFMQDLWDNMLRNQFVGVPHIFEAYCRVLIAGPAQDFQCRPCCGKKNEEYKNLTTVALGGCKEIRLVSDIFNAAKEHPMVLFHSTDPQHPLYDFMYCNSKDGIFHAFQATMGETHYAKENLLKKLRKDKLGPSPLVLYYLVPEERFNTFVTKPVKPFIKDDLTHVWHILIPNPNGKQTSTTQDSQM